MSLPPLAACIDYTLLKPTCTGAQVQELCEVALRHGFASVCLPPVWVPIARQWLPLGPTRLGSVAGFPLGHSPTAHKLAELNWLYAHGAEEVDVVWNLSAFKTGMLEEVGAELQQLAQQARQLGVVLKVILETGALTEAELQVAIELLNLAQPHFAKTSTGFFEPAAERHKVEQLRRGLLPGIAVKASGGIRRREDAEAFLQAGATRIGTSSLFTEAPGG